VNDFERCLNVLLDGGIEFIIIGGVAMYAHGSAQLTRDLDICYERSRENIERLAAALSPYHPRLRGAPEDLPFHFDASTITKGMNFTLATDLGDVDLMGEVKGLGQYDQVRTSSIALELFGRSCKLLSLDGLIRAKRATGRSRDAAAVAELEALRELTSQASGATRERATSAEPVAAAAGGFAARVLTARSGAVVRLVINRPPLNILDLDTVRALNSSLATAFKEEGVRLIEVRGAGEKAFSAGVEIRDHFPDRAPEMLREFHALIRGLLYAPFPSLAVVHGHCLGGGMELASACDFIVASEDAHFGQPEIKVGALPPVAAVLLPRLIAEKKALELVLTGEPISAGQAQQLGLVNRVAETRELEAEATRFSSLLLAQSAQVTRLARKATRLGFRAVVESSLREAERIYLEELLPAEDASEGLRAFLEKRPAAWKNK
jgi:cyclohexa-1,5-dienecarbonyl-CoA hydratase